MNKTIVELNAEKRKSGSSSLVYKVGIPVLSVALGALGYISYKAYIEPWGAYADGDMSYLERVDPRSLSGGDLTHYHFGGLAFEQEAPNLPWGWGALFDAGDGVFERPVTPAVKSEYRYDADGVGPIYNANFCEGCHQGDGRAQPQLDNPLAPQDGLLIRLSIPGTDAHGGPKHHPVYGGQFGDRGLPAEGVDFNSKDYISRYEGKGAVKPEGRVQITHQLISGKYADGTSYELMKPIYQLVDLNYGPLGDDIMTSPRIAPQVFGLGLLDAIPVSAILENADVDDKNNDGISGKPQYAWNLEREQIELGRFGWKMETTDLAQQSLDAASNDIGMSSYMFPKQTCTETQTDCKEALHGGREDEPEYSDQQALEIITYMQLLGVPGRRGVKEEQVLKGEHLFRDSGCNACHIETFETAGHEIERLNNQVIHPYTDLLLHDMGPQLADNRPSFEANGQEWRTAPLWGIGLVPVVNGHTRYLHDGRARNLGEAILWHGGEAEQAKGKFLAMSKEDREALLFFLDSL